MFFKGITMKQQIVLYVIIALFGLVVGATGGVLITKAKADKNKAIIADLQSRMQKSEMVSQEKIQKADTEIMRLNSELILVKTELEQVKSKGTEAVTTSPQEDTGVKVTAAGAVDNINSTATTEYTVKEGDSLWEIAASQLGDGNRYKEIIKLNPNVSAGKNLAIGTKLKIPTR
jgi:nucleoid-associated protein YgaU